MAKATRVNTKTPKKRPDKAGDLVGVRVQDDLAKAIDDWRRKQDDLPGRPEAIRRLVEAGLAAAPATGRRSPKQAAKAEKMAATVVDRELGKQDERGHVKARRRKALLSGQDDLSDRKKR
jgi:hypothetical protein